MLDVVKIATLKVVLQRGSFSAAASALHLTQPAVSRQVSQLERSVGTPLVRRTQRGVYPTEAGELLIRHTDAAMWHLERAEDEVRELAGFRRRVFRLGSFFTALVYLSADVAVILGDQHPDVVIADDLVDRADGVDKVARGVLDAAVFFSYDFERVVIPAGVQTRRLFDDPVHVLLPAGHRLASQPAVGISDLDQEIWIRPDGGILEQCVDDVLVRAEIRPALMTAGHGDEPIEIQALVAAGRGITLAHELNVIIDPGQVVSRPISGIDSVRHVDVAYPTGDQTSSGTAGLEALVKAGRRRPGR